VDEGQASSLVRGRLRNSREAQADSASIEGQRLESEAAEACRLARVSFQRRSQPASRALRFPTRARQRPINASGASRVCHRSNQRSASAQRLSAWITSSMTSIASERNSSASQVRRRPGQSQDRRGLRRASVGVGPSPCPVAGFSFTGKPPTASTNRAVQQSASGGSGCCPHEGSIERLAAALHIPAREAPPTPTRRHLIPGGRAGPAPRQLPPTPSTRRA
jgi:hypothetical protein